MNVLRLSTISIALGFLCACGGGGGGSEGGNRSDAGDNNPQQFFVAKNGSDDNDGLSPERAFRTISRATNIVGPGDQVFVAPGEYREAVAVHASGTAGAPIVVSSHPGQSPAVIDGSEADGLPVFYIGGDYVVLSNVITQRGRDKGVLVVGNHNTVEAVTSRNNRGVGIQIYQGSNNTIRLSTAHGNVDSQRGGEDADGFGVSGNDNTLIACTAFGNSDDGFDAWESRNTVIERSIAYGNGSGSRGDGNGFKLSNLRGGNTVARKNIAYGNKRRGFTNNGGSDHAFINNTAFGQEVNFQSTGSGNNQFINNVSVDGGLDLASAAAQQSNSWNLGISPDLPRNPAAADFLSPGASSAVVDRGVDVGIPFTGGAKDLGALEAGETIGTLLR